MTSDEDAMATWELLSEAERKALAYIAECGHTLTPDALGRALGISWQAAVRTVRPLNGFGLIRIERRPKMVWYEISGQGEACLKAGKQA
jgi:uncharacterized membrane protein